MKDFLEQYNVKLVARGPVFVGSGKEITKKEYISLPNKQIGIMNIGLLYQMLKSKGRERAFEQFMMGSYRDLGKWLDQERLLDEARKKCVDYTLDMGSTSVERGKRMQIMSCIKDAYGKPYIPGSTLKGMLRGILLASKLMQDNKARMSAEQKLSQDINQRQSRTKYLSYAVRDIEASGFRTLKRPKTRPYDAVNDELSGFIVSDSDPIECKQLVLAQKVERRIDGEEKTLNLLREALCPGTEIHFTVTVDHSLCPVTKDKLLNAIAHFDDMYNECYLKAFRGMDILQPNKVFVGGGSGFVSKTVLYPIMGKAKGIKSAITIFNQTRVPRNHGHSSDEQKGASPHILKCSWYKGKTLQMGLCDLFME